jgi:glycosyltransferase involved in cell wall biosynthesis
MKRINYIAPFNKTGYGVASIGYLKGLAINKQDLNFSIIGSTPENDPEFTKPDISSLLSYCNKPNFDDPSFIFWHLFDINNQSSPFKGPKVGFTTFEIDTLRPIEIETLKKLSLVGTASSWGKSILAKYMDPNKIFVAPHAFRESDKQDITPITPDYPAYIKLWKQIISPAPIEEDTLILSTAGKYESRKGHLELIKACMKYGEKDPVLLITFIHNPFITHNFPYGDLNNLFLEPVYTNSGIKVFRHKKFQLVLMPPTNTRTELHGALSKAHYFVAPSKAEGWNLPLFEMMSYSMPSIATLCTAHSEFCTKDNVIPITTSNMEIARDGKFFDGIGNWYSVTPEAILDALYIGKAKVLDNSITKLASNASETCGKFSWQKSAKLIMEAMNQVS